MRKRARIPLRLKSMMLVGIEDANIHKFGGASFFPRQTWRAKDLTFSNLSNSGEQNGASRNHQVLQRRTRMYFIAQMLRYENKTFAPDYTNFAVVRSTEPPKG